MAQESHQEGVRRHDRRYQLRDGRYEYVCYDLGTCRLQCLRMYVFWDCTACLRSLLKPADYFIRLMASRINAAFGHLHRSLLKETVEDSLSIAGIIEDFKLPEPDKPQLADLLNNIAIGKLQRHPLRVDRIE